MKTFLLSVRTLLAYLVIGCLVALPFAFLLPFIPTHRYAFRVWFAIDVLICTVAHGTVRRTISGWTGQHAETSKRYRLQATVIDWILLMCGDGMNHCERAYQWEIKQGIVR